MNELLKSENLIELHDNLHEFANYHQNKGGQKAHQLIKKTLIDDIKKYSLDGSAEGILIKQGYDSAIRDVLSLLHSEFVP